MAKMRGEYCPYFRCFFVALSARTQLHLTMLKNFINRISDNFNKESFGVAPQKKLKTISKDFEAAFGLELVFYKGKKIAEGDLTLAKLNTKTAASVNSKAEDLSIKGSMSVKDVERLFHDNFGTKVQIKSGGSLVSDDLTLGDARRQAEG